MKRAKDSIYVHSKVCSALYALCGVCSLSGLLLLLLSDLWGEDG